MWTVRASREQRWDDVAAATVTVVALRFRYDPALKDLVKDALWAEYEATGEFAGTWDSETRYWWCLPEAWRGVARRLQVAGVVISDSSGFRGFDTGPEPEREREQRRDEPKASPPPPKRAPHEVLGVSPRATAEDLKAAYLALVKQWHPDRLPDGLAPELRAIANQRMAEINAAYDALKPRTGQQAGWGR